MYAAKTHAPVSLQNVISVTIHMGWCYSVAMPPAYSSSMLHVQGNAE